MVTFKLIATLLVVFSICNSVFAGKGATGETDGTEIEVKEETSENEDSKFETDNLQACKLLLNELYFIEDEKRKQNFDLGYQLFTSDIIRKKLTPTLEPSPEEQNDEPETEDDIKLRELKIEISVDFYIYLIEHHAINLSILNLTPNSYCGEKAHKVFENLDTHIKESEGTEEDVADVCKGLLKSIGVTDPNTAELSVVFKMFYLNMSIYTLKYETLTSISLNDNSRNITNDNLKKNRKLTLHTIYAEKSADDDPYMYNKHSVQEKYDLDDYINLLLRPYFYEFMKSYENYYENSEAFPNAKEYCQDRGVQLLITRNIRIPKNLDSITQTAYIETNNEKDFDEQSLPIHSL